MTSTEQIKVINKAKQTAQIHHLLSLVRHMTGIHFDSFMITDKRVNGTSSGYVWYLPGGDEDSKILLITHSLMYSNPKIEWVNYNELIADDLIKALEVIFEMKSHDKVEDLALQYQEEEFKRIAYEKDMIQEQKRIAEEFSNYIPIKYQ